MKITPKTKLWDVDNAFSCSWIVVHMKDGRTLHVYMLDVDDEFQRHDEDWEPELNAIVYNTTGSNSYGNGIAFDDIDSIELDPEH